MDKVQVYMCLHIASTETTAGNKTRFFLRPFVVSTSRFLDLAKPFRNDYVAACSTVKTLSRLPSLPLLPTLPRLPRLQMGEIAEVGEVGEVREITEVSEVSKASKVRNFTNDCCDVSRPALDRLDYQGGRQRTQLRDKDRPGNDTQLVPSFPSRCSWMFPEQLRNGSELLGSEEVHQV